MLQYHDGQRSQSCIDETALTRHTISLTLHQSTQLCSALLIAKSGANIAEATLGPQFCKYVPLPGRHATIQYIYYLITLC